MASIVANDSASGSTAGSSYYTAATRATWATHVRSLQDEQGRDDEEDETPELSEAARRAAIKDSWDFFRMVCSLLRDQRKYDDAFRRLQMDPTYPYLNSMTGMNDPGDDVAMGGNEGRDKPLGQEYRDEYGHMSESAIAKDLVKRAEVALPSLVEICNALAKSLGMEEVGVGPVKEAKAAVRKAGRKYDGDLLKVTDYCRALLVVEDLPALLALLELSRDSFGKLIRRVKLGTLKTDRMAKPGGYRDCVINLELKGHICEIQVHIWPMWAVCGVDGFRHYRHCLEYSTDTFGDPYEALAGLDRDTMAELISFAEDALGEMPLGALTWKDERYILDYFALAGLYLRSGLNEWAELTLRALVRLRRKSPEVGPIHLETVALYGYLGQALQAQEKNKEAEEVAEKLRATELRMSGKSADKVEADKSVWDKSVWDQWVTETIETIVDPLKKEREEEKRIKEEVRVSKKAWKRIREERFKFIDGPEGM